MMSHVKIGFIGGCGHHYLKNLAKPDSRPADLQVAIANDEHDPEASKRFASTLSNARWFDSADELFQQFKPDVVNVGAVHGFNADFCIAALSREIPVVSDKPIAASWKQFHALAELVGKSSRPLLTEFPTRWDSAYDAAQHAIASGQLGEVALVHALRSYRFGTRPKWYADRASFGGLFLWVGSHEVDVVRFVTGMPIAKIVAARHGNLAHPEFGSMEDHAACVLSLENGATATVEVDYLRPASAPTHGQVELRVAGSKGTLEVRPGSCMLTTAAEGPHEIAPSSMPATFPEEALAVAMGKPSDRFGTSHSLEMAELMLRIRDVADGV